MSALPCTSLFIKKNLVFLAFLNTFLLGEQLPFCWGLRLWERLLSWQSCCGWRQFDNWAIQAFS
nr:hypothetical protein Iba_chr05bCG7150 [Ipomoea batatas]